MMRNVIINEEQKEIFPEEVIATLLIPDHTARNISTLFLSYLTMKLRVARILRNLPLKLEGVSNPAMKKQQAESGKELINAYIYEIQPQVTALFSDMKSLSSKLDKYCPYLEKDISDPKPDPSFALSLKLIRLLTTDATKYKERAESVVKLLDQLKDNLSKIYGKLFDELIPETSEEPIKTIKEKIIKLEAIVDENNKTILNNVITDGKGKASIFGEKQEKLKLDSSIHSNSMQILRRQEMASYKTEYNQHILEIRKIDPSLESLLIFSILMEKQIETLSLLTKDIKTLSSEFFEKIEKETSGFSNDMIKINKAEIIKKLPNTQLFFESLGDTLQVMLDNVTLDLPEDTKEEDLLDMYYLFKANSSI